jgi:hypothetical protein
LAQFRRDVADIARFQQACDLHGQGRATGDDAAVPQHLHGGAGEGAPVDPGMVEEAAILVGVEQL